MNTPATPQRRWTAACPQCGAPVAFASAASAVAVCSFCRSTLAREGPALRRLGESAELFDDHSPLQLGSSGRWQGLGFTLVGRLQMAYPGGRWNEWHALFDNGRSAWLVEDNGRHVMSWPQATPPDLPLREKLLPGAALTLEGRRWFVAAVVAARIEAAEGELPQPPRLGEPLHVVELRHGHDEVGALEWPASGPPSWSVGRSAELPELALKGLRDSNDRSLTGRSFACPSCGNPLALTLATTRSIACAQCHAVVDVSQGIGADLAHHAQHAEAAEGGGPQIPLGASGRLDLGGGPRDWQVVGYLVRRTEPQASTGDDEDDGDEVYFWREYLLYAREVGFAFLIDADDGWSYAVPATGVPVPRAGRVRWRDRSYQALESYHSRTTWVLGEFYWRVEPEQRTRHVDYRSGPQRLNFEHTGDEITWSAGTGLDASTLARAFGLSAQVAAAMAPAARLRGSPLEGLASAPSSGSALFRLLREHWVLALFLLGFAVLTFCTDGRDDCAEVRATFGAQSAEARQCEERGRYSHSSSGGSYGGSSGGWGGHK